MKKAISTLLALILAISLLSSFGIAAAEEAQTEDIIHLEPLSVPESYKQNCSEMGSLEMISYTVTSEKDTDKTTEKTAYVPLRHTTSCTWFMAVAETSANGWYIPS